MAPSLTCVINAVYNMLRENPQEYAIGILNATISLRNGDTSLILVADGTEHTTSLGELLALATEKGIPVVFVGSKESLGSLVGYASVTTVSANGGSEHLQVVVDVINTAKAAGAGENPAPSV